MKDQKKETQPKDVNGHKWKGQEELTMVEKAKVLDEMAAKVKKNNPSLFKK